MLEICMTTNNEHRKKCSVEALGYAQNTKSLQRSFDLILSDDIRDQVSIEWEEGPYKLYMLGCT